jgi:hypothetical protein
MLMIVQPLIEFFHSFKAGEASPTKNGFLQRITLSTAI